MTPSTSPAPEAPGPAGHGASTDPEVRARILSQRAARYARRDQAEDDGQHVRLLFFSHGSPNYPLPVPYTPLTLPHHLPRFTSVCRVSSYNDKSR